MGQSGALSLINQILIVTEFCSLAMGTGGSDSNEPGTRVPNLALRIDQPHRQSLKESIHLLEPDVFLVNTTGIFTLRLDCWAPYPIDLRFYGHLVCSTPTYFDHIRNQKNKYCFINISTKISHCVH